MKELRSNLKSDPTLAKPEYLPQAINVAKPSALEMWLASPRHYGYPWNIIRMWFPEGATGLDLKGNQLWQWPHVSGKNDWARENSILKSIENINDLAVMTRTVKWHADQVEFEIKVKNITSQTWSYIRSGSCLQLSAAPDYADDAGTRTYLIVDGDFLPTSLMAITDPGMRGWSNLGDEFPMKDGTKKRVTEGVFFVVSKDKKYVLGYSWQPPENFFYNRAGIVSCIHISPINKNVEPQKEATAQGLLFVMDGTLEDAYKRYKTWQTSLEIQKILY